MYSHTPGGLSCGPLNEAQNPNQWGTPHQYQTQVRFWIPLEIPTDHDYMMPRLPENAKIKIPQVGSYFTL